MPGRNRRRRAEEEEKKDDPNRGPVTVVRREDRKDGRYEYKLAKIDLTTDRNLSKAAKRDSLSRLIKWFLIAIGVIYAMIKFGGGGLGKVFEFMKGFGGG